MGLPLIKNFLNKWYPHPYIVYRSWYKGDSHIGKYATVIINYLGIESSGTFSVKDGICNIRIGKKGNRFKYYTPIDNVKFKKKIKYIDTIRTHGQNGWCGKEIIYILTVIDSKKVKRL